MAWATKCDRCGKYFEYHEDDQDGVTLLSYERKRDLYHYKEELDLCPDCVKSFEEWFKKRITL